MGQFHKIGALPKAMEGRIVYTLHRMRMCTYTFLIVKKYYILFQKCRPSISQAKVERNQTFFFCIYNYLFDYFKAWIIFEIIGSLKAVVFSVKIPDKSKIFTIPPSQQADSSVEKLIKAELSYLWNTAPFNSELKPSGERVMC